MFPCQLSITTTSEDIRVPGLKQIMTVHFPNHTDAKVPWFSRLVWSFNCSKMNLFLTLLPSCCRVKSNTCMITLVSVWVLVSTQSLWLTFLVWLATKMLLLVLMLPMIGQLGISPSTVLGWASTREIFPLLWCCKFFASKRLFTTSPFFYFMHICELPSLDHL